MAIRRIFRVQARALVAVLLFAFAAHSIAASRYARITKDWNAATWSATVCGGGGTDTASVPVAGDNVTICGGGITVTLNQNTGNLATLDILAGGTLNIGNAAAPGTARTLASTGAVTNAGTLQYATAANHVITFSSTFDNSGTFTSAAVAGTKRLTVTGLLTNSNVFQFAGNAVMTVNANGGISNSGTFDVNTLSIQTHVLNVRADILNTNVFDLSTGATSIANASFLTNGNQTVSGAGGTTRFNRITVNMGAVNTNILEITTDDFQVRPTNFLTLTNGTFKLSTPATASITPFTGAATISATRGLWLNSANITLDTGNDVTVTGTSDAVRGLLRISSGIVNIGNAANEDLIPGNFSDVIFEGGTTVIAGGVIRAAATNNLRFTMSAGTLTVAGTSVTGAGRYPFQLDTSGTQASFIMSGGTIVVERSGAGSLGYRVDLTGVGSTVSVTGGTLQIGNGSLAAVNTMQINTTAPVGNLVVNDSFATAQLLTNSLTVLADITITAGSLADAGNQIVGNATGTLSMAAGTFLTLGSAGTATLFPTLFTAGNIALTSTSTVTYGSGVAQTVSAAPTAYSNLTINNAAGVTLEGDTTVNDALTFTAGDIATGAANTLTIGASGSTAGTPGTTRHVVGNMAKAFPAIGSFTYTVGDGTNYTPLTVQLYTLTTTGSLTVSATSGEHPDTTLGNTLIRSAQSVNRYWTLKASTLAGIFSAAPAYVAGDLDALATYSNFNVSRGATCTSGPRTCTSWALQSLGSPAPTATLITASAMSMTSGAAESDLVVGEPTLPRVMREKEFIFTRELY